MTLKNLVGVFFLIFCATPIFAQDVAFRPFDSSTNTYGIKQNFPMSAIADDFGPRDLGDDWHGGVDYNVAQGDGNGDFGVMLLAPESGTFPNSNQIIRSSNRQIRYQVLDAGDHRYAFVHMLDKNQGQNWYNDSTIYISPLLSLSGRWGMVILIDSDTLAIGQISGADIIFQGDTLTVTNAVAQYDPIGPLGNSGQYQNSSGVWKDYIAHLHLNTIPDTRTTINDT